ncbi:hypothetical protein L218DRAFT_948217 [Marasmius fiardii PR-910]|nr:hypothetical protein L218DRAFT_948217 [Marasmius fiardii PR-910]
MVLLSDVQVLETLEHQMLVRYFLATGGALFVYDVLINLDVEIEHILGALDFRKQPTQKAAVMFNLLYLLQRYLPLLDQVILDPYFLLAIPDTRVSLILGYTVFGNGDRTFRTRVLMLPRIVILTLRVWAVWGKKPSFILMLTPFAVAGSITAMVFIVRFVEGIEFPELDIPVPVALRSCLNLIGNRDILVCWILLMVYDSDRIGGRSNLLKVVYRDVRAEIRSEWFRELTVV